MSRQPSPERTGWRDEAFSRRHRDFYGFHCPAVDVDFLLIEYSFGHPAAIVDYKRVGANLPGEMNSNRRALEEMGDRSRVPAFYAVYGPPTYWFVVHPLNGRAKAWFTKGEVLTERQYVERLYAIRGQPPDTELLARLHNEMPSRAVESSTWQAPLLDTVGAT